MLYIEPFNESDFESIIKINSSYIGEKNESGFLFGKLTNDFLLNVYNDPNMDCYCLKENNAVVGYAVLSNKCDDEPIDEFIFEDNSILEKINGSNHVFVRQLAIKKGKQNQGLGLKFYELLFEKFPNYLFTATIATEPLNNKASVSLHKKVGFENIGKAVISNCFGFDKFTCLFFAKNNGNK